MTRGVVVTLIIAALGVALWAAVKLGRQDDSVDVAPASIAVASMQEFTPRITSTGSVRLAAGARVNVGAQVSGVVMKLAVTQGSRVARGDLIAKLDDREARARLAEANAKVLQLSSDSALAATELARVEALAAAIRGATEQELNAARARHASAASQLQGARAQEALAQITLDRTIIRSPVSGVIASVTTHEGETIASSFTAPTFVTIVVPTQLECVALVDESDIGRVRVGQTAEFTVDSYPGDTFPGVVTRIAPDATIIGGVVDYEVTLKIVKDVSRLKPQMTANITIGVETRRALVVPSMAVRQGAQGLYVWRLRDGKTERVVIAAGVRQLDVTEVTTGIAAGDTVLTAGFPEDRPSSTP